MKTKSLVLTLSLLSLTGCWDDPADSVNPYEQPINNACGSDFDGARLAAETAKLNLRARTNTIAYETIGDGAWENPANWKDGNVPPTVSTPADQGTINIKNVITFDGDISGKNFSFFGTIAVLDNASLTFVDTDSTRLQGSLAVYDKALFKTNSSFNMNDGTFSIYPGGELNSAQSVNITHSTTEVHGKLNANDLRLNYGSTLVVRNKAAVRIADDISMGDNNFNPDWNGSKLVAPSRIINETLGSCTTEFGFWVGDSINVHTSGETISGPGPITLGANATVGDDKPSPSIDLYTRIFGSTDSSFGQITAPIILKEQDMAHQERPYCPKPLPVDLKSFTAKSQYEQGYNDVKVDWVTASETSNAKFVVMMVPPCKALIEANSVPVITITPQQADSISSNSYGPYFTAVTEPGTHYFRLRQFDTGVTDIKQAKTYGWRNVDVKLNAAPKSRK